MFKNRGIYLFLLFILVGILSCKKYPEGGKHFGAMGKLRGGIKTIRYWKVVSYQVNGVDSTAAYFVKTSGINKNYDIAITPFFQEYNGSIVLEAHEFSYKGTLWNKKTELIIRLAQKDMVSSINGFEGIERNIFAPYYSEDLKFVWVIQKLTKESLRISNSGVNDYVIELKRVKKPF